MHVILVTGEYRYCSVQEAFDCIDRMFGKYCVQTPPIKPVRMLTLLTNFVGNFALLFTKQIFRYILNGNMMTGVAFKIFITQATEEATNFWACDEMLKL